MKLSSINENYEIKTSRTGEKIPVLNGVHIHSAYNPTREAEGLIERYKDTLKNKKDILFMGLGFGYHIHQALKVLKEHHKEDYKVYVIEPSNLVAKDCFKLNFITDQKVIVLQNKTIEELFFNERFITFLLSSPGVIAHPSSFNLHSNYFKEFLQYKACNTLSSICKNIKNTKLKNYIKKYPQDISLSELSSHLINEKRNHGPESYLLLALESMTSGSKVTYHKETL